MDEGSGHDDPRSEILGDEKCPFWNTDASVVACEDWKGSA